MKGEATPTLTGILDRLNSETKVVVFSGAGMSAESGIATFRDQGGLWEQYPVEEVATPEAWRCNPEKVLDFYNQRRKQLLEAEPNPAHQVLAELEKLLPVHIITQNIDDLHERAGSLKVLHLHGELRKAQSTIDPNLVYPIVGWELLWGSKCRLGSQLRPMVVWFGEEVPMMEPAEQLVRNADLLLVIGTSLNVYPAAGLVAWAPRELPKLIIDPQPGLGKGIPHTWQWQVSASAGMKKLFQAIKEHLGQQSEI